MILRVAFAQPVFDYHKHDFQKSKDGSNKKESASFASILEDVIRCQPNGK